MPTPTKIKAVAFFDGQNLYRSVKKSFGYNYPNYDPQKLAKAICRQQGWILTETRFYTGVPSKKVDPFWHYFWTAKLNKFRVQKRCFAFTRQLAHRTKTINCPNCGKLEIETSVEKGVDVRIAIDVIAMALKEMYDVALIFSQDQDLSEVADEVRDIARLQKRFIKMASAFPKNPDKKYLRRGINKTDWIPFEKDFYDKCIDPRDYRNPLVVGEVRSERT